MKGRNAKVINFGSGAGIMGREGYAAYGTAKEAIRSLTKVAAREWGREGIRVNVICPHASSPGYERWAAANPELAAGAAAYSTSGRVGDCELDIGRAALFLASDDSSYVSGHTLIVDGVMHCAHAVVRGMVERGWGRVIAISSDAGRIGVPELSTYAAGKAGAAGFLRSLAKEVGQSGVTCNVVSLGLIPGPWMAE